ncbi:hypothetical protein V1264_015177 [Littorina saxatilis]|uniref:Uncharacterized protein n=1 Tax=Littorina saxatilis TaxID=31220 RepID=A0AAN9GGQ2_9CAEN
MNGVKDAPANKKGGILETSDVFNFVANDVDNLVILYEKNGQFKITYGVYEPGGRWHQTSGFQFDCYSNIFVPTDYPTQLCGQGLPDEVKAYRNANGWTEDRRATIFYNVFTNTAIVQTNPCCVDTASAMQTVCTTVAQRYKASKLCWPIVGDGLFHECVTHNSESAESAMKHCVEYVCSGFTDIIRCLMGC